MNNELQKKSKLRLFLPCYYAFFVNGAMVLLVGAILPYLIEEAGINYSVAGNFLSAFAIGNLLASFINPFLASRIGRKKTTVILVSFIPLSFFAITFIPPVPVICVAFILAGIGRGSVSIINNAVVNDNTGGKPGPLNLLHMVFACGAFIAPFLTSLYVNNGLDWRAIVYTTIVATIIAVIGYGLMDIDYDWPKKSDKTSKTDYSFLKSVDFYIAGILLFLYLGVENCVNGWFVTYFKSMGIMTDTYATSLVSLTWIMVMLGRLTNAILSSKLHKSVLIMINCVATAIFFIMLISTTNLSIITAAIAGLGFFLAGIYPAGVSSVGNIVKGSTTGMSFFLAIAALGGIVTPKIVGIAADHFGMIAAIMILIVNVIGMLILGTINLIRSRKIA